jgi:hypothetical protein
MGGNHAYSCLIRYGDCSYQLQHGRQIDQFRVDRPCSLESAVSTRTLKRLLCEYTVLLDGGSNPSVNLRAQRCMISVRRRERPFNNVVSLVVDLIDDSACSCAPLACGNHTSANLSHKHMMAASILRALLQQQEAMIQGCHDTAGTWDSLPLKHPHARHHIHLRPIMSMVK